MATPQEVRSKQVAAEREQRDALAKLKRAKELEAQAAQAEVRLKQEEARKAQEALRKQERELAKIQRV